MLPSSSAGCAGASSQRRYNRTMPTNAPPEALPNTTLRFGLRTLMRATSCAVLIAAPAGAIYRRAAPQARAELVAMWVGVLSVAAIYAVTYWWGSYRRTRAAGPARYRLRRPDRPSIRFSLFWIVSPLAWFSMLILLWVTMMLTGSTLWLTQARLRELDDVPSYALGGVVAGVMLCGSASVIGNRYLANRWLKLADHGVDVDGRVVPWGAVVRCSWHFLHPSWLMISTWSRSYAADVPDAVHEEVEAFMRLRCAFDDGGNADINR